MRLFFKCAPAMIVAGAVIANGQPLSAGEPRSDLTRATYSITGLHCPPCTRTVESALKRVPGVASIKVDWSAKTARVEFDESVLSAQKIAQAIAATPHMMGGRLRYAGWLSLQVPDLRDEASASKVKNALASQPGVKRVVAYPALHAVNVEFDAAGSATTRQLLAALTDAGFKATP